MEHIKKRTVKNPFLSIEQKKPPLQHKSFLEKTPNKQFPTPSHTIPTNTAHLLWSPQGAECSDQSVLRVWNEMNGWKVEVFSEKVGAPLVNPWNKARWGGAAEGDSPSDMLWAPHQVRMLDEFNPHILRCQILGFSSELFFSLAPLSW